MDRGRRCKSTLRVGHFWGGWPLIGWESLRFSIEYMAKLFSKCGPQTCCTVITLMVLYMQIYGPYPDLLNWNVWWEVDTGYSMLTHSSGDSYACLVVRSRGVLHERAFTIRLASSSDQSMWGKLPLLSGCSCTSASLHLSEKPIESKSQSVQLRQGLPTNFPRWFLVMAGIRGLKGCGTRGA